MNHSSKSTGSSPLKRILVTTGDPDGIGWEVTAKALNALGPQRGIQFTVFVDPRIRQRPILNKKFKVQRVQSLDDARTLPRTSHSIVMMESLENPARWVENAAQLCLSGEYEALVTAPLSKTTIKASGMSDIGHTEILARVSGVQDLFMGFIGKHFSVVLATGHESLREAQNHLTPERLDLAIQAAVELRKCLPKKRQKLPLGIVGVNPHAGEGGLMGQEELWMKKRTGRQVRGPLVPDAAFLPHNWKLHSVFVTPFHDQGLIPFKLVHGFEGGVHLTLNLPFVRTSVDHGTAKELFGLNKAQPGSMKDAISTAIRLLRENMK